MELTRLKLRVSDDVLERYKWSGERLSSLTSILVDYMNLYVVSVLTMYVV